MFRKNTGIYISERIKNISKDIFPDDTYPFAKALIIGDKTEFYEDPILDFSFRTAGLSHIVAVSGMHLSFVLAIPALFVKNRKRFSLTAIPFIILFVGSDDSVAPQFYFFGRTGSSAPTSSAMFFMGAIWSFS